MTHSEISKATLGRLPLYLRLLKELPQDRQSISATAIARLLNLGEVQVRKDLSAVSGSGKPKIGYDKSALISCLENVLDDSNGNAVLVGAGKLGKALLDYSGFSEYGLHILAAFDNNTDTPCFSDMKNPILPLNELENFCKENNIKIGIITVPAKAAQEVCDRLTGIGIKALWSFTPCKLAVPDDIRIRYEDLALSLAHLKQYTF